MWMAVPLFMAAALVLGAILWIDNERAVAREKQRAAIPPELRLRPEAAERAREQAANERVERSLEAFFALEINNHALFFYSALVVILVIAATAAFTLSGGGKAPATGLPAGSLPRPPTRRPATSDGSRRRPARSAPGGP